MPHPISDILRQLVDTNPSGDSSGALDAFKRRIWHRSFWVAGTNTLADNGSLSISMNLADPVNGSNNVMRVFADKEQAEAECGADGCMCLTFRVILVFAETKRMDAYLFDGDEAMLIAHDQLMALRDQAAMGGEGVPMSEQEVREHTAASVTFARRARYYCGEQSDIESLHLALFMMPGVKLLLAGTLNAKNSQQHMEALIGLSRNTFSPRWRFSLYDPAEGGEGIAGMLQEVSPCFDRARDTGMWNKFKNAFSDPVLGICKLDIAPDPTAMALDDPQVPQWASD